MYVYVYDIMKFDFAIVGIKNIHRNHVPLHFFCN